MTRVTVPLATVVVLGFLAAMMGTAEFAISVRVLTNKLVYAEGEAVTITILVRNNDWRTQVLEFQTSCRTQFEVHDGFGTRVYRSAYHYACLEILGTMTLGPGESRLYSYVWDQLTDGGASVPRPTGLIIEGSFSARSGWTTILLL